MKPRKTTSQSLTSTTTEAGRVNKRMLEYEVEWRSMRGNGVTTGFVTEREARVGPESDG
jgi:hypothetical protein